MRPLLILILMAGLMNCNKKENELHEAARLYKESMNIHDELMPRMDEMYKLERKLKSLRDSLLIDSIYTQQKIARVRKSLQDLETASEKMMHWMHNIQDVPGEMEKSDHEHPSKSKVNASHIQQKPGDILKAQQQQKANIELIKVAMENSIRNGQQVLKDHIN